MRLLSTIAPGNTGRFPLRQSTWPCLGRQARVAWKIRRWLCEAAVRRRERRARWGWANRGHPPSNSRPETVVCRSAASIPRRESSCQCLSKPTTTLRMPVWSMFLRPTSVARLRSAQPAVPSCASPMGNLLGLELLAQLASPSEQLRRTEPLPPRCRRDRLTLSSSPRRSLSSPRAPTRAVCPTP